jgi:hypothetical protein
MNLKVFGICWLKLEAELDWANLMNRLDKKACFIGKLPILVLESVAHQARFQARAIMFQHAGLCCSWFLMFFIPSGSVYKHHLPYPVFFRINLYKI